MTHRGHAADPELWLFRLPAMVADNGGADCVPDAMVADDTARCLPRPRRAAVGQRVVDIALDPERRRGLGLHDRRRLADLFGGQLCLAVQLRDDALWFVGRGQLVDSPEADLHAAAADERNGEAVHRQGLGAAHPGGDRQLEPDL